MQASALRKSHTWDVTQRKMVRRMELRKRRRRKRTGGEEKNGGIDRSGPAKEGDENIFVNHSFIMERDENDEWHIKDVFISSETSEKEVKEDETESDGTEN